jgi:hypothetical protein
MPDINIILNLFFACFYTSRRLVVLAACTGPRPAHGLTYFTRRAVPISCVRSRPSNHADPRHGTFKPHAVRLGSLNRRCLLVVCYTDRIRHILHEKMLRGPVPSAVECSPDPLPMRGLDEVPQPGILIYDHGTTAN